MQQVSQSFRENENLIQDYSWWFNFFVILPKIITIILSVTCFILGLYFCSIYQTGIYLLAFWLGGALNCVLTYLLLKLSTSYKILHICYLKKLSMLSLNDNALSNKTNVIDFEDLPKI